MIRTLAARLAAAVMATAAALAQAQAPDRIVFATDWLAQAEHGGFYQALAEGIYKRHNLDVTIRMSARRSTACSCSPPDRSTSRWPTASRCCPPSSRACRS